MKFISVPYEGRAQYHEGLLVRAAIAMKLYFPTEVSVSVITSKSYFVDAVHGMYIGFIPISVMPNDDMTRLPAGATVVTTSEDHPYFKNKDFRVNRFIVPMVFSEKMTFRSKVFGATFDYPDLPKMMEILPPDVVSNRPRPFLMRS